MDNGTVFEEDAVTGPAGPSPLSRWLSLAGRVLTLLAVALVLLKLYQNVPVLSAMRLSLPSAAAMAGGVVLLLLLYTLLVMAWMVILRGGGVSIPLGEAYRIMGDSQIGKYLPGNIYHYIRRVSLGVKYGLPAEACILSLGVETALLALTALCISLAGALSGRGELSRLLEELGLVRYRTLLLAGISLAALSAAGAFFSRRVRTWVAARGAYLHPRNVVTAVGLYALFFLSVGGLTAVLLASFWTLESSPGWLALSWGFALAWLLGFVTPGSPGGLGIREMVFVGVFGRELGEGPALGVALVLRVLTSLSDVLTFGIAAWLGRRIDPGSRPSA